MQYKYISKDLKSFQDVFQKVEIEFEKRLNTPAVKTLYSKESLEVLDNLIETLSIKLIKIDKKKVS